MLTNLKEKKLPEAQNVPLKMTVTPEMARDWLARNSDNRSIVRNAVKRYAADIREGRWLVTGDAVRFDNKGVLIDGQHRLLACIDADTPFETFVLTGLPNQAKGFMDIGAKRTAGTILGLDGYPYANQCAAAARNLNILKYGQLSKSDQLSIPEIHDIVKKHPGLGASVEKVFRKTAGGKKISNATLGPSPAALACVHYAASDLLSEKAKADAFIEVFRTGVPTYDADAAHALRERMIREKTLTGQRLKRGKHLNAVVYAWNLFSRGIPIATFRAPNDLYFDGLDLSKI